MDLSDLRIFRAVAREGGVTRAAEKLHRVQSNVTTRIRQLEEDLGAALFVRSGKRLHLAPAGQVLLAYADRLLDLAEEARAAVQDPSPRGVLRLGAMESTAAVRLPGPLSAYHARHPRVTLELRTGNPQTLAAALLRGELDVALVAEPLADPRLEKSAAFSEALAIVSSLNAPTLEEMNAPPSAMIAFEHGCPHRKRLEDWYLTRGGLPERVIELGSYHAMLACVAAGMGVALLPLSVLSTFPESRRLKIHPLPPGEDNAETVLIWRKGGDSPTIAALRQILAESISGEP